MHNDNSTTWELPFDHPATMQLQTEFGNLSLVPVEPGQQPRLELSRGGRENVDVHIEKVGDVVRVALDPHRNFSWFGGWECRAMLYVPRDVRASIETNAGSVSVRNLEGCELGVKANAGKIDIENVYGLLHLGADAGSVVGRGLGGYFDIETNAGSIRMEILDLQPGEHRVRAIMGSVRLELARGMDLSIETHTSLGSVRNNYASRADAPTRLVVTTEMGSVRVDEAATYRPGRKPTRPAEDEKPAAAAATRPQREDPELDRILQMVEAGTLSAQVADELLRAMGRL
jgi:hypothetical protein